MGDIIQLDQLEVRRRVSGAAPVNDLFAPGGFLAAVNAVHVTGAHLARAIETIRHIQVRSLSDIAEHGRLLEHFAHEQGLGDHGGAALHARVIALDRWAQAFDPLGESDISGFYAAGGSAPLVETEAGLGFEPAGFAQQVEKWTKIFA
ncbi:hypothetical protein [Sphingopyxis sp. R3-92]|uniref:hypothetical protein n=1 Tax=Sphingopyxis sp. R3-92 TaxID=3158553 RepID=UPI003EE68307